MRAPLAAGLVIWFGSLSAAQSLAAGTSVKLRALGPADSHSTAQAVASGSLDDEFQPFSKAPGHNYWRDYWLKISPQDSPAVEGVPVVIVNTTRGLHAELVAFRNGSAVPLSFVTQLPAFLGGRDNLFTLPEGVPATQALYAHLTSDSDAPQYLSVKLAALDGTLALGTGRARIIALTFGALMAVSLAALLIWFVLKDPLFILYATMFSLQALYVAFISGQGFDWPVLSYGANLDAFAWNVPVALSGAVACLFTREIADLKRFSPRIYKIFGWSAVAFVVLSAANVADFVGLLNVVNVIGNIMFIVAPIFTVIVCFLAWRRGNRAAGWFLIAWCLLEGFTIAAAVRLLASSADSDSLYYYGLPLSMVAASILVALGVADRLRAQRLALTEAERRAQTDPLHRSHSRRTAPVRRHWALRRRRVCRDLEQRRCRRCNSHCAAHRGARRRCAGGGIRRSDPCDLQHRHCRERHARHLGRASTRAGRRSCLCCEAIGAQSDSSRTAGARIVVLQNFSYVAHWRRLGLHLVCA